MPPSELKRALGVFDSVMLIVGSTVGIGVFVTTGFVAQHLSSAGGVLLVWLLGALLALAGALSCAELAVTFPKAGGDYVYLREAYGPLFGFLSGWSSFFVTFSGSVASLGIGFTQYLAFYFPVLDRKNAFMDLALFGAAIHVSAGQLAAVGLIFVLSLVQSLGIRRGSNLQNVLSLFKIGAILAIVVLAVTIGQGNLAHFTPFFAFGTDTRADSLGLAFIPILFTYAGWNSIIYLAEEVKEPESNLPRALVRANLLIAFLYLGLNAVLLYGAPLSSLRGHIRATELATSALFGYETAAWINAIIALSILGSLNAVIMTGPRIYFAMAGDRLFFPGLSRVHPRFGTPTRAIWFQFAWASVLMLSGTFAALLTYVTFTIIVFSSLTVGAVLVLRFRQPRAIRAYRAWGYPVVPLLFVTVHLAIALVILWQRPVESFLGVTIASLGVPAYFLWKNWLKKV